MESQKGWKDFKCELNRCDNFLVKHFHYGHARFKQMVANHGPEKATKLIVTMDDSTRFQWLKERELLDYSIEATVLKQEYQGMWEIEEQRDGVAYRELCKEKLERMGWKNTEMQIRS